MVYVLDRNGTIRSSFNPSRAFGASGYAVYDPYLDSFVILQSRSPHLASRVARNLSVIGSFGISDLPQYRLVTLFTGGVAKDSAGRVFVSVTNFANTSNPFHQVCLFNASNALELAFVGGKGGAVAASNGLIYVPNLSDGNVVDTFSLTGRFMGNLSIPALKSVSQVYFIASGGS